LNRNLLVNGFNTAKRRHILVLDAGTSINGSRCIISADQAVHFCGFAEEGSTIVFIIAGFCV